MFQLRTSGIEQDISKKLDTKKINYFIENNYLESSLSTEGFSHLLNMENNYDSESSSE